MYKQCRVTNVSSRVIFEHVRSPCPKMSSKNNCSSVCPGTVLSVFCLLLYSAGFIRIELKFNNHDQRMVAVEEVISKLKHGIAETSNKGTVKCKISMFSVLNTIFTLKINEFSLEE